MAEDDDADEQPPSTTADADESSQGDEHARDGRAEPAAENARQRDVANAERAEQYEPL